MKNRIFVVAVFSILLTACAPRTEVAFDWDDMDFASAYCAGSSSAGCSSEEDFVASAGRSKK